MHAPELGTESRKGTAHALSRSESCTHLAIEQIGKSEVADGVRNQGVAKAVSDGEFC